MISAWVGASQKLTWRQFFLTYKTKERPLKTPNKTTYRSLEQRMMLAKISLHCILKYHLFTRTLPDRDQKANETHLIFCLIVCLSSMELYFDYPQRHIKNLAKHLGWSFWWWLSNTRPCTPWSSVKNKRFLLSFCHLPIKFHNFWWDLGPFAPPLSSSWCHRYPPPTFATTWLSLSMSLFYCSLVALYLLLPLDPFTPGLYHLR